MTAGASGHPWCRAPVSLYPQCHNPCGLLTASTGGHHCLCSTLSSFALKAVRSLICLEESIFTGSSLCRPHTACGTWVLFLVVVASSSLAVCRREAQVQGHVAPSLGRNECSGSAGPLFLELPPGVTDVVEVGASTNMGIAFHHVWAKELGGIRVLRLGGEFTGTERGTSFSCKCI